MARKGSTIGPAHDGGPKKGFFAPKGKPGLDVHHGPSATTNASYAAPHVGARKAHVSVPTHSGMVKSQTDTAGLGGRGHATVYDGGAPTNSPLAKPPVPKRTATGPAPATPGTRSRRFDPLHGGKHAHPNDHGLQHADLGVADPADVLSEAVCSGGKC